MVELTALIERAREAVVFRFNEPLQVCPYRDAVDFRPSLNGLSIRRAQVVRLNPMAPALFVLACW